MTTRLVLLFFWIFQYLAIFSSELDWIITTVNICHVLKSSRGSFFFFSKSLTYINLFNHPNNTIKEVYYAYTFCRDVKSIMSETS